jgi:hypothetical protein
LDLGPTAYDELTFPTITSVRFEVVPSHTRVKAGTQTVVCTPTFITTLFMIGRRSMN